MMSPREPSGPFLNRPRAGVYGRRGFVRRLAGALPALACSRALAAAGAAPSPVPAIDTHTHFYDPTRPQGVPWPPPANAVLYRPHLPDEFTRLAAPCGVVGTVVVEASPWVEDNQWMLDLAREHPAIVGYIGRLEPGEPAFGRHLERFARDPLFLGLRLNGSTVAARASDAAFAADLTRFGERELTLDVLRPFVALPQIEKLAVQLPGARMVLNHLPFGAWDREPAAEGSRLAALAACGNVYVKLSDVVRRTGGAVQESPEYYRERLDRIVELFGEGRVLFGSNWPVSNLTAPYATVHGVVAAYFATRGPAAAENYFWRNSLIAYRWLRRGAAAQLGVRPG
jgi:L-fuconolactonase